MGPKRIKKKKSFIHSSFSFGFSSSFLNINMVLLFYVPESVLLVLVTSKAGRRSSNSEREKKGKKEKKKRGFLLYDYDNRTTE